MHVKIIITFKFKEKNKSLPSGNIRETLESNIFPGIIFNE